MMYKYWFACIEKRNNLFFRQLLKFAGSAKELYGLGKKELMALYPWREENLVHFLKTREKWELQKKWEFFLKTGMKLVTMEDKDYPAVLHELADAPYGLFYYGDLALLKNRCIAIVGARRCTEYGRKMAEEIAQALAGEGVTVVSGMAQGVDAAAHYGAIKENGKTTAVLGNSVDICYPRQNRRIYDYIKEHGLILSEYPPGTEPVAWHFPVRNRIISGLSECVVVVEARKKSGSLITVDCALEQGRDIYAVPGRTTDALSQGCNALLMQGAGIIMDAGQFLEELDFGKKEKYGQMTLEFPLEKDEMLLYSCFDLYPKNLETLLAQTTLTYTQVLTSLVSLQAKGYIKEIFKNYYIKN